MPFLDLEGDTTTGGPTLGAAAFVILGRLVATQDSLNAAFQDTQADVRAFVHLESHLVLVLLDGGNDADDAPRSHHPVVLLEAGKKVLTFLFLPLHGGADHEEVE